MSDNSSDGASRVRTRNPNPAHEANKVASGSRLLFSPAGEDTLKSINSQVIEDPFSTNYKEVGGEMAVIQPPFNFMALQKLPLENSMLRQCIEAMVVNTEGHGWRLEYVGPEGEEESAAALAEKNKLHLFLLNPNPDYSLEETRSRLRADLETIGNAALEALRTEGTGEVSVIAHVPFSTLRMTAKDSNATNVEVVVQDEDGNTRKFVMQKKFRRFIQRSGTNVVYFKEFGDPRVIRADNGQEDNACPVDLRATEILHLSLYAPGQTYGLPRWINQIPAILGSRQSELTNLDFFRENAIPAMAILVSGGRLTRGSVEEIENHFSAARGRKSMNRVVVLEAVGDDAAASEDGTIPPPKVDMKPLAGERQKEGFFLEYGGDCDKKIRSAFRMPPIFVGHSDDYSHATAKASYEVAESQVFGPARRMTDDVINTHILRTYNPRFWEVRANPPKITDPEEVIKAIEAFARMGAMTPNQVIDMANEYFDLEIAKIEDAWGDIPFEFAKALMNKGQLDGEAIEEATKEPDPDAPNGINPLTGQPNTPPPGQPGGPARGAQPSEPQVAARMLADSFLALRSALIGPQVIAAPDVEEDEEASEVVEQRV